MTPAFMSFILLFQRARAVSRHPAAHVYRVNTTSGPGTHASGSSTGAGPLVAVGGGSFPSLLARILPTPPGGLGASVSAKPRREKFPHAPVFTPRSAVGGFKTSNVDLSPFRRLFQKGCLAPLCVCFCAIELQPLRKLLNGSLHAHLRAEPLPSARLALAALASAAAGVMA